MTIKSQEWLSVAEFADRFTVSTALVYREISAGNIPALRLGGSIRISAKYADQLGAAA